ncbi:TPA: DUF1883 domain-containing protein [Providencia rettgeri]
MPAHSRTREYLDAGCNISVQCSHQTNVMVMDDENYELFNKNEAHEWIGGFSSVFPVRIVIPESGYWNIVISVPDGVNSDRFTYSINKN